MAICPPFLVGYVFFGTIAIVPYMALWIISATLDQYLIKPHHFGDFSLKNMDNRGDLC